MSGSWVNSAERIGADLHLELSGPGGRRAALTRALRDAVRGGRLAPGTRLPPYRSLAADLGVARNTVADAYAELVAEGWLTARQGSGTRVAERAAPSRHAGKAPGTAPPRARGPRHDLRQGTPDVSGFPRTAWLASYRRALQQAPNEVFGPGDPAGRVELREALAEYLARARGVRSTPERIVICSGFAHALRLLSEARVLRGPLAVEAYGLPHHRDLLSRAGVRTVPLPLDERGARVDLLERERGVLLTPAHQFPTGGPLHAGRRAAVVDWARARGGLIVEDDYDGEFRYDSKPLAALRSLDEAGRVIYVGSFSKVLFPALRMGYLIMPPGLRNDFIAAKWAEDFGSPAIEQAALANFIGNGGFERHLRRSTKTLAGRRAVLMQGLESCSHGRLEIADSRAGMHVAVWLRGKSRAEGDALIAHAQTLGLGLHSIAPSYLAPADRAGLLMGFAAMSPSEIQQGIEIFARCLDHCYA